MTETENKNINGWQMIKEGIGSLLRGDSSASQGEKKNSPPSYLNWKTTPDKEEGWSEVRPVAAESELNGLMKIRGSLTKLQQNVEKERKKFIKKENKKTIAAISVIAVACLGLWFLPKITSGVGEPLRLGQLQLVEISNHEQENTGFKIITYSLQKGAGVIHSSDRRGILDLQDYYRQRKQQGLKSDDNNLLFEQQLAGSKLALKAAINQDFPELYNHTSYPEAVDAYRAYCQGKEKNIQTLMGYYKQITSNPDLAAGESVNQYWQNMENRIKELVR